MPTINDIAKIVGVSKSTVSKALNDAGDISGTLRKKILETAVEIGYEKNRIRKDTARKLCILIENMDHKDPSGFGHDLVIGFEQMAVLSDWEVDVVDTSPEQQSRMSYDAFMLGGRYEGAFILGLSPSDPWMEDLKDARTPAVLYDNYIQENPLVAYVGVNSDEGLEMAVSYLKRLGHTRIGYLGGELKTQIGRERYQAYMRAMEFHGLSVDQDLVYTAGYGPGLLGAGATAVLCQHDQLAAELMGHCRGLGYRIPEDISVIGFDDAAFSAHTEPPLTTVRQDRNALGRCGYYALASLLGQTYISSLLLRAELVVRGSAGPVRAGGGSGSQ